MYRRHCWPERGNSRDRSPASNIPKALLARKREFEYNYSQEFPRRSKCSAKGRVVEKLIVCSGDSKEMSTRNLERKPVERPFERKRHIPLILE
jgi:hypothetical protein